MKKVKTPPFIPRRSGSNQGDRTAGFLKAFGFFWALLLSSSGCSIQNPDGVSAVQSLAKNEKLCVNATNLKGEPFCTEVSKSCPVLVKFLASWCDTCTIEMKSFTKSLSELPKTHRPKVLIVGVFENKDTLAKYGKDSAISYPLLLDDGLRDKLSLFAIPGTVLLGPGGTPIEIKDPESGRQSSALLGPRNWASPQAKALLKDICRY